jgi:hypothetical protein
MIGSAGANSPHGRRVKGHADTEKRPVVSAVVTDEIERGNAVVITSHGFAIDNAGARAQAGQGLDDL